MSVEKLITDNLELWTGAVTQKSASGRGSGSKRELTGIKKLRELILELAVRGKLVPQITSEGCGSDAVARMVEERADLFKQGVLKRSKAGPKPDQIEKPFQVPPSWAWATLPMVSRYGPGKTPATKNARFWADAVEGYAWVSITDMDHYGSVAETARRISDEAANEVFKAEPVPAGAILMSFKLTVGKVAINQVPVYHNEAIISIFPFSGLSREYLFKTLPMLAASGKSKAAIKGNTLNAQSIAAILVPVPPLAEQHRIVQKVDELMALCDQLEQQTGDQIEAHERLVDTLLDTLTRAANSTELAENWARVQQHFDTLFTTEHSIDRLKQAILQLAVMGRLVSQDPSAKSAKLLLQEAGAHRRKLVELGQAKSPRRLPPIADEAVPYELPDGWIWVHFQDTGFTRLGKMLDKAKNRGSLKKYLRNTNVQWWSISLDDLKELRLEEHELEEYAIQNGDLLICEGGEPGRCAVWSDGDRDIYFQKALHRHRPLAGISSDYLKICLTVGANSGRLAELFTGATIKHLPGDKLARYICPLPPVCEQGRIVREVERLMDLCDILRRKLRVATKTRSFLAAVAVEQAIH